MDHSLLSLRLEKYLTTTYKYHSLDIWDETGGLGINIFLGEKEYAFSIYLTKDAVYTHITVCGKDIDISISIPTNYDSIVNFIEKTVNYLKEWN